MFCFFFCKNIRTGQGSFLTNCSDEATIARNSGIFWAMLQTSMFFGNLFVFFQFQGKNHIDEETRNVVFTALIAVGTIGLFFLIALRPLRDSTVVTGAERDDELDNPNMMKASLAIFRSSVKLILTKDMLLLSLTFFYTG